jgi:hypothetical protein
MARTKDNGLGMHKKTDKNDILLRGAIEMGLDITELNVDIQKHLDFYIMASNAYLRVVSNDREFAGKSPIDALYEGRDLFVNMMDDFVEQYRENKSLVVEKSK